MDIAQKEMKWDLIKFKKKIEEKYKSISRNED